MYDYSGGREDKDKGCVLAGVLTCLCSPAAQLATLDALSPNVSLNVVHLTVQDYNSSSILGGRMCRIPCEALGPTLLGC